MKSARTIMIAHWVARLVVVGIFAMGVIPKFTGNAGALAEKLPGGNGAVLLIGLAELVAIVLILLPKTTLLGAALASAIMLGAIGSHVVGPVGMEGDLGAMLPMAVVAFLAAGASGVLAWKRGLTPFVKHTDS